MDLPRKPLIGSELPSEKKQIVANEIDKYFCSCKDISSLVNLARDWGNDGFVLTGMTACEIDQDSIKLCASKSGIDQYAFSAKATLTFTDPASNFSHHEDHIIGGYASLKRSNGRDFVNDLTITSIA